MTGLVGAAIAVVGLGIAAFQAKEVADRLRADTAVQAEMTGEPDCIVGGAFTAPDGRRQVVDLRTYKSNCISGQPGQAVTVYYDASDPTVNTKSRSLWWPALLALLPLLFGFLGVRTVLAAARGVDDPHHRPERPDGAVPHRRSAPAARSEATGQLYRGDDAHLVHDYATGRLAVLLDEVRAELSAPATSRGSTAHDASLSSVLTHLESVLRAVEAGNLPEAERQYAAIARIVVDEWDTASPLGQGLLAFRRNMLKG